MTVLDADIHRCQKIVMQTNCVSVAWGVLTEDQDADHHESVVACLCLLPEDRDANVCASVAWSLLLRDRDADHCESFVRVTYLGAEQHREAHFLAISRSGDFAIHDR